MKNGRGRASATTNAQRSSRNQYDDTQTNDAQPPHLRRSNADSRGGTSTRGYRGVSNDQRGSNSGVRGRGRGGGRNMGTGRGGTTGKPLSSIGTWQGPNANSKL